MLVLLPLYSSTLVLCPFKCDELIGCFHILKSIFRWINIQQIILRCFSYNNVLILLINWFIFLIIFIPVVYMWLLIWVHLQSTWWYVMQCLLLSFIYYIYQYSLQVRSNTTTNFIFTNTHLILLKTDFSYGKRRVCHDFIETVLNCEFIFAWMIVLNRP